MNYHNPKSIDEALILLDAYKDGDLVILAGGTDVVPRMNSRPEKSGYFDSELLDLDKRTIVYIGDLGLDYVKAVGDCITIGAFTTMSELLDCDDLDKVPVLKCAISQLAGLTVRNTATIGGNIMNASPAADTVPALIVMDACVVLASVDGERTVSIADLFVGAGQTCAKKNELLKEIIVPIKPGKASFIKFGRRKSETLSVVNGAAYAEFDDGVCRNAVVALGAVAPTPLRAKAVEDIVNGKALTEDVLEEAAECAAALSDPIDDKRGSGDYRKKMVKVLVKRALAGTCQ